MITMITSTILHIELSNDEIEINIINELDQMLHSKTIVKGVNYTYLEFKKHYYVKHITHPEVLPINI